MGAVGGVLANISTKYTNDRVKCEIPNILALF